MQFSVTHCLCFVFFLTLISGPQIAEGIFSNTIHGFVQDVKENPVSVLALLAFKYWILLSTGAISVAPTAGIGKRDVSAQLKAESDSMYAQMISRMDNDQCVPKLICLNLAQPGNHDSLHDKIMSAFGEKKPSFPADDKSPLFLYKYAAFMGQHASSVESCSRLFPKCKQTDAQLQKTATFIFESDV